MTRVLPPRFVKLAGQWVVTKFEGDKTEKQSQEWFGTLEKAVEYYNKQKSNG